MCILLVGCSLLCQSRSINRLSIFLYTIRSIVDPNCHLSRQIWAFSANTALSLPNKILYSILFITPPFSLKKRSSSYQYKPLKVPFVYTVLPFCSVGSIGILRFEVTSAKWKPHASAPTPTWVPRYLVGNAFKSSQPYILLKSISTIFEYIPGLFR